MRFNRIAATTLSVGAAIVMTAASAGAASAATGGNPKHGKPKHPVTQVTGSKLAKALVPASAFGGGYKARVVSTGNHLSSTKPRFSVTGESCKDFEVNYMVGYGDTAEAGSSIEASDSMAMNLASNQPLVVTQDVAQFASSGAAWTFFRQMQAKFSQCPSIAFTTTDNVLGQITETVTNQGITSGTLYGHAAFQVDQADQVSDQYGDGGADSLNTTVIVAGTNVYEVQWLTGDDLKVPNWLVSKLIKNVQAQYKG